MVLVQFNFDFPSESMGDTLTKNAKELAESINKESGFVSKIWIENPDTEESGGIYIFKDKISAENYVKMHSERVQKMGVKEVQVKYFQINETLSKINQGL